MSAPARSQVSRDRVWGLVLVVCAALAISQVRWRLFATHKRVKEKHDVYFLPPARQVVSLSLGYQDAVADLLWAHVLVSQGLHTFELRRFDNLVRLYDVINELAPTYRTPYLLADALITVQAGGEPSRAEVLKVREILERGIRHRPHDAELWLNLGQYMSFIAPASYFEHDQKMAAEWRVEGVKYLARAAELGGDSHVAWGALGGAGILRRAGDLDAWIRFLERSYAATDDSEYRERVERELQHKLGERAVRQRLGRYQALNAAMTAELPWIRRDRAMALGPPLHPERCAGPGHPEMECAATWREWSSRFEKKQNP